MLFSEWVKRQNDEFFTISKVSNKELICLYARDIAKCAKSNVLAGAISDCSYRISVYRKGKKTIMQIINMKKEKRGIAICHENDEFDPEIGIAYAWARYKKEPIPTFSIEKKLSEMQSGERFTDKLNTFYFIGKTYYSDVYVIQNEQTGRVETLHDYKQKYRILK